MIVDLILDRKDNLAYNAQDFCEFCLDYVDEEDDIVVGLRVGDEARVKAALYQYIKNNEYNPLLIDYIEQVNWVGVTSPEVERAAAVAFNEANALRFKAVEKELESLKEKGVSYETSVPLEAPKDKIFVAVLDYGFDISDGHPEEYTGDNIGESYMFDTPEEFVAKWHELDDGAWYWVFDKGETVCSGALDPNDIEIFEDYWGKRFEEPLQESSLDEKIEAAKSSAINISHIPLKIIEQDR